MEPCSWLGSRSSLTLSDGGVQRPCGTPNPPSSTSTGGDRGRWADVDPGTVFNPPATETSPPSVSEVT